MPRPIAGMLLAVLLAGAAPGRAAQPGPVEVEATVDRASITVGDQLVYSLKVRHRPEIQVELPPAGAGLEGFEIKDHEELPSSRLEDGRLESGRRYVLSTFTTGEYTLAPQTVRYRAPQGKEGEVQTGAITIRVRSILPQNAKDIRDIHGPAEIPVDRGRLVRLSLLVLGAGAAAASVVLWRRRRRAERAPESALPPYEQARRDLDELAAGGLLDAGRIKEFYVRLADILRVYLGRRYRISALVETSAELLAALHESAAGPELLRLAGELFESSDLVKFAKYTPSGTETREHFEGAYHLLEITRPEPVAVAAGEAA